MLITSFNNDKKWKLNYVNVCICYNLKKNQVCDQFLDVSYDQFHGQNCVIDSMIKSLINEGQPVSFGFVDDNSMFFKNSKIFRQ